MSSVKFRAVQTTGTFKNDEGETKKSYQEIGVVFETENGHLAMKLSAYPLPNEKGEIWVNLYPNQATKTAKAEKGRK